MALPHGLSLHRRGSAGSKPLGIIDAVGTGCFRPYHNYLFVQRELQQTCFVECKASRADFLRDCTNDGQMMLCMNERHYNNKRRKATQARAPDRLGWVNLRAA